MCFCAVTCPFIFICVFACLPDARPPICMCSRCGAGAPENLPDRDGMPEYMNSSTQWNDPNPKRDARSRQNVPTAMSLYERACLAPPTGWTRQSPTPATTAWGRRRGRPQQLPEKKSRRQMRKKEFSFLKVKKKLKTLRTRVARSMLPVPISILL